MKARTMTARDIGDIVLATVAGFALGYLVFAVQEASASNERAQRELVIWQADADIPEFHVSDKFIKDFQPGELEDAMKEKHGVEFTHGGIF